MRILCVCVCLRVLVYIDKYINIIHKHILCVYNIYTPTHTPTHAHTLTHIYASKTCSYNIHTMYKIAS